MPWLQSLSSGRSRGGPQPPLFRVKKEEMTEGRKVGRASKTKPGPHLCSKSGSATAFNSGVVDSFVKDRKVVKDSYTSNKSPWMFCKFKFKPLTECFVFVTCIFSSGDKWFLRCYCTDMMYKGFYK